MAVHRDHRGNGAGTAIIEAATSDLRDHGYSLALAMTSAAHKVPVEFPLEGEDSYNATRAFWVARGFHPLIELDIWDTDIALLMVRPLG
jgi:GNAT superfamily N-acetyltransferase